ncbi:hypothetical protein CEUSTIGMA_g12375.t1 [Chlamydomonas eustigma]|uniref:C2H2-type domain-containing protein n=1 Tax=Chlamydomonas eustigma TaxID=1157962 RepID=A0A250XPE0_9CHLO|nr:hypothetical protein CEUSTIGMA_g12375.t1 [Chlamydomonas eustigma]|eukprot:GAX84954.1 hypothetical protein CEUSTIGMA_g12375.t1 [Chlamydomonas eustigma]
MDKESHAKAHQPSWAAVAKGPFPLVSSHNPQSKQSVSGSYAKVSYADLGSAVWLSQARQSPVDPSTGKVRCRACGVAFVSYTSLAQHLGSKHGGLNSEDSKYAQLRLHASASQSHQKPVYESHESMFPDISASRPHASAERPETSLMNVEELPRSAAQPASSKSRQSVKLSDILKTAEPTSATTSKMRHTGTSKPSAKILMSNTLRISVTPTKTKKTTAGVQRGGSVASSARTLLFGKQGPGDKHHGRKPRIDPSVIPEGLRLKGAHKPRISKLKQQILRLRADQALIAAQKAHEGASQAFLKLLAECEALLEKLKSVAESLGLPIDQLQVATIVKPDAVPNLTAVEPRTSSPVAADPSLRAAASAGTEVMALSPRLQPQASPVQLSVLQRALKTAEAKLRKAESELDGTQQRLRDRVRERAKVYKLDVEMEEQEADVQLGSGAGGVIEEQVVREEVLRGQKLEEAAPKEQETKKGFSLSAEATGTIALLSQAASSQVTMDQEVAASDVSGMVHITAKDASGSTIAAAPSSGSTTAAAPLSSSQALPPGGVVQTKPRQLSLLRKPLTPNLLTSSLMGGGDDDDDDDDDTSDFEEEEEGTGENM